MVLKFHPESGTILVCDFAGFRAPEMVKVRPVPVVSPRLKRREGLLTVVPLSTTQPDHVMEYHCSITLEPPLPEPFNSPTMWVKGDRIYNVAFNRRDLVRTARDHTGKRKFIQRQIGGEDIARVTRCVLVGLGLPELGLLELGLPELTKYI